MSLIERIASIGIIALFLYPVFAVIVCIVHYRAKEKRIKAKTLSAFLAFIWVLLLLLFGLFWPHQY